MHTTPLEFAAIQLDVEAKYSNDPALAQHMRPIADQAAQAVLNGQLERFKGP